MLFQRKENIPVDAVGLACDDVFSSGRFKSAVRAFTVPSRYKLRLSVCAIRQDTRSLVILPEEATLTRHGTPNVDGMVAVTCLGSLYSVFSVDLEERAILIEDAVAEKRAAAGA